MIQDIYPSKLNNQYDPEVLPGENDFVIFIEGNRILLRDGSYDFPKVGDFAPDELDMLIYLFSVDDERFFLGGFSIDEKKFEKSDFSSYDLKVMREEALSPQKYIFAAYTAKHLSVWYGNNRFCGRCGQKLTHSKTERAMCCPSCQNTIYPKIMPAVIVGVINNDKMLITRYRNGYNHNALIAGFTEIGETLEETVAREVMEEAGVKVKNIRYYKSQPWGIAADILAGFYCEIDGDDTIKMDNNELKFAEWLKADEIVLQPDSASLTNEMMKLFKEGKMPTK